MLTINQVVKGTLSNPIYPTGPYVLAVSGGPDSQCLLKAVAHVAGAQNCLAVGVDHNLRKAASDELDLAEQLAKDCDVEFRRVGVNVARGSNLHARARDARYGALFEVAREIGAPFLVTGHHKDDQAETLLIKLLRGVQPRPIKFHTEFKSEQTCVVRPLLLHTRQDILKYLKRWKVQYATDPSNSNPRYLRSWVRNELIPTLEKRSPKIRENIINLLSQDTKYYYEEELYDELDREGNDREAHKAPVRDVKSWDRSGRNNETRDHDSSVSGSGYLSV